MEEIAPVEKRGKEWNPLGKISKIKAESGFRYLLDLKKIEAKRAEAAEVMKQYGKDLTFLKEVKQKCSQSR